MKKRFDYFLDIAHFPLIALFIAALLIGIANILVSPEISVWSISDSKIILASSVLKTIGYYVIQFFPLLLLINATSKKLDDSICGLLSICSYFTVLIMTMFFASTKLPIDAYTTGIGMQLTSAQFSALGSVIRHPLQLGIVLTFICYYIVKFAYSNTRNRKSYGMMSFIDKNTAALIMTLVISIFIGIIVSYVWTFVIEAIYIVLRFIADDITNPFNLFLYGVSEKLLGVVNMNEIPRNLFYFTDFGGSWLDSLGRKFVGDVGIWTAQLSNGTLTTGIGRFTTASYVINIFAIPGYLVALFTMYTNRFERRKYLVFLILAIVASCFMGNSVPFELFMLCATPLLFVFHVFISGVIYALLAWLKIYIGYSFTGIVALATPGSITDLFVYLRSINMNNVLQYLLIIGIIVFIIYFILTKVYYNFLSIDIFQSGYQQKLVEDVIAALGGVDNIKVIDSNILKILVQVNDETIVDVAHLRSLCNSRVFESKTGYVLYFYKASHVIHSEINKALVNKPVL